MNIIQKQWMFKTSQCLTRNTKFQNTFCEEDAYEYVSRCIMSTFIAILFNNEVPVKYYFLRRICVEVGCITIWLYHYMQVVSLYASCITGSIICKRLFILLFYSWTTGTSTITCIATNDIIFMLVLRIFLQLILCEDFSSF